MSGKCARGMRAPSSHRKWRDSVISVIRQSQGSCPHCVKTGHPEIALPSAQVSISIANVPGLFCIDTPLNHPQSLQAHVAVLTDDQMIMDGNLQRLAHRDDLMGEVDVGGRWLWIARGMIMH